MGEENHNEPQRHDGDRRYNYDYNSNCDGSCDNNNGNARRRLGNNDDPPKDSQRTEGGTSSRGCSEGCARAGALGAGTR